MTVASWEELATELAEMARDLVEQDSVQATLDRIVAHAVGLVDGCEVAGILSVDNDTVRTLSATDQLARAADRVQAELREGPCYDAATRKRAAYRIQDLSDPDCGWPRYVLRARELGIGSMMGFLLYIDGRQALGALNIYSSEPSVFTERSERVGWVLAAHCAAALTAARHEANLGTALQTARLIGAATGIVMSRYRLTEQAAFDRLATASQRSNVKVRDLAQSVLEIGELPD